MAAPIAVPIVLDEPTRRKLHKLARSQTAPVRTARRARMVLAAADGAGNEQIAAELSCAPNSVRTWRGRFAEYGIDALADPRRSGRPRRLGQVERVAVTAVATSAPPKPAATWTHAAIAGRLAEQAVTISASHVGRILAEADLKPYKVRGWLNRRDDPAFWDRAADICDLYLNPPPGAVVLSIDEKTAIAARSRKHPDIPAAPGRPARREFEYKRHGTVSLMAALDVACGQVYGKIIARNDADTFIGFLTTLDAHIDPTRPHRAGQRLIAHREEDEGLAGYAPTLARPLDPATRLMAEPDRTLFLRPGQDCDPLRRLQQPRRSHREDRNLHPRQERIRQALPMDLRRNSTESRVSPQGLTRRCTSASRKLSGWLAATARVRK